jgi:thioredoxin 1
MSQRVKDIGTVILIVAVIVGLKWVIDRPDGPPGAKVGVLTEAAFEQSVIRAGVPVAVDFRSTTCPACKLFRFKLEDASLKYDGRMKFYEFDIYDGPTVASRFGIEALPTTHIFVGGKVVSTLRGNVSKGDLERRADEAIARNASIHAPATSQNP